MCTVHPAAPPVGVPARRTRTRTYPSVGPCCRVLLGAAVQPQSRGIEGGGFRGCKCRGSCTLRMLWRAEIAHRRCSGCSERRRVASGSRDGEGGRREPCRWLQAPGQRRPPRTRRGTPESYVELGKGCMVSVEVVSWLHGRQLAKSRSEGSGALALAVRAESSFGPRARRLGHGNRARGVFRVIWCHCASRGCNTALRRNREGGQREPEDSLWAPNSLPRAS